MAILAGDSGVAAKMGRDSGRSAEMERNFGRSAEAGQQRFFSRSQFNFLYELNKNTLNMLLAKVVLLILLRYSSICSQHIQMLFQLFKLSHLNKQFYIEQYCTTSQHALQLEIILC